MTGVEVGFIIFVSVTGIAICACAFYKIYTERHDSPNPYENMGSLTDLPGEKKELVGKDKSQNKDEFSDVDINS